MHRESKRDTRIQDQKQSAHHRASQAQTSLLVDRCLEVVSIPVIVLLSHHFPPLHCSSHSRVKKGVYPTCIASSLEKNKQTRNKKAFSFSQFKALLFHPQQNHISTIFWKLVCWMLFQWTTSFAFNQQPWGKNKKTHSLKHQSINQSNKKKQSKGFWGLMIGKSKYKSVVYISNNKTKWKQKKSALVFCSIFCYQLFVFFFFFASTKDRDSSVPISTHEVKLMQSKAPKKLCNTKANQQIPKNIYN